MISLDGRCMCCCGCRQTRCVVTETDTACASCRWNTAPQELGEGKVLVRHQRRWAVKLGRRLCCTGTAPCRTVRPVKVAHPCVEVGGGEGLAHRDPAVADVVVLAEQLKAPPAGQGSRIKSNILRNNNQ